MPQCLATFSESSAGAGFDNIRARQTIVYEDKVIITILLINDE
jgi:hypothetical protein